MNNKHLYNKNHQKILLLASLHCVKCDTCFCTSCDESFPGRRLVHNKPCTLSDEEFIIKNIIE